jgi:hypothetical protein
LGCVGDYGRRRYQKKWRKENGLEDESLVIKKREKLLYDRVGALVGLWMMSSEKKNKENSSVVAGLPLTIIYWVFITHGT